MLLVAGFTPSRQKKTGRNCFVAYCALKLQIAQSSHEMSLHVVSYSCNGLCCIFGKTSLSFVTALAIPVQSGSSADDLCICRAVSLQMICFISKPWRVCIGKSLLPRRHFEVSILHTTLPVHVK
jgi:hypothetical protein